MPHPERQKDSGLEFLLLVPSVGLVYFVVFSFTGGFARAIHARDHREDSSLIANAGIGLVGWVVAAVAWLFATDDWPTEVTLGLGVLALLTSIGFVHLLDRRRPAALDSNELRWRESKVQGED